MKHELWYEVNMHLMSPPTRGRGLKQVLKKVAGYADMSPPTRGRGLKLVRWRMCVYHGGSPPTRGRGLKPVRSDAFSRGLSRPPRGGVD